jgi:hypothetical protein
VKALKDRFHNRLRQFCVDGDVALRHILVKNLVKIERTIAAAVRCEAVWDQLLGCGVPYPVAPFLLEEWATTNRNLD